MYGFKATTNNKNFVFSCILIFYHYSCESFSHQVLYIFFTSNSSLCCIAFSCMLDIYLVEKLSLMYSDSYTALRNYLFLFIYLWSRPYFSHLHCTSLCILACTCSIDTLSYVGSLRENSYRYIPISFILL